jgi:2',3'-cyclic-nucleotide 2'-phosphodiesterase (5'-nucleotidase family)
MQFPILAANLRLQESNQRPAFVEPFTITEINDITIGIIGLTTTSLLRTTKPAYVTPYIVTPYKAELRKIVPDVKSAGAELLIVIGHICLEEMESLLPLADSLGIKVITGGHCHQLFEKDTSSVTLVQSGAHLENYAKMEILFDDRADTVISINSSTHPNKGQMVDESIERIVRKWQNKQNHALSEVIGFTDYEIPGRSDLMHNMITDAWLYTYPDADIAITNKGGIRQSIPVGPITVSTIFGVLPFKNNIYQLELTGAELIDCLETSMVVSGFTTHEGFQLPNGAALKADSTYRILTNDFLYSLPNLNFKKFDPEPYDTGVNYRQPVIDWIKSMGSTIEEPLPLSIDPKPRR